MEAAKPARYNLSIVSSRHVAGVPVTHVTTQDRYYHGRRFHIERRLVRLFTNFLQWYLRQFPDMPFESRANLARYLAYIPSGMRAWRAYMPGGFATYHVPVSYTHLDVYKRQAVASAGAAGNST